MHTASGNTFLPSGLTPRAQTYAQRWAVSRLTFKDFCDFPVISSIF